MFNDLGPEYEGLEIIVKQAQIGICAPEVIVDSPQFLMPAYPSEASLTFTITAPLPNLFYIYTAYVVMADGTHHQLYRGVHEAGCGDAVAARGFLVQTPDGVGMVPCPNDCWDLLVSSADAFLDFSQLSPEQYMPYVDAAVAVDLFGIPLIPIPMPGDPALTVTGIAPTPDGLCGPVSSLTRSWGSIKAIFR